MNIIKYLGGHSYAKINGRGREFYEYPKVFGWSLVRIFNLVR